MPDWKVPLADVRLGAEEITAVTQVLQSGWLSQGPLVARFETEFARFLGTPYAIAVANGTAALHLACLALNLGPGDEVLCPSLTFVASANALCYTGARPVFVDIKGPHNLNISVEDAAAKVTPRTRALMVVHYGGFPCPMEEILALARRHNLRIIEDCAHAPGAICTTQDGPKKLGTFGDLGCFSFFANKNLTTGEGGMVVTSDPSLAERLRQARSHGMTSLTWDRHQGHAFSYNVLALGYNYRLDEMRAALGLVQLTRLPEFNARRRQLTRRYREILEELPQLVLPFREAVDNSACHLFPILLPPQIDRRHFMQHLAAQGIQTSIHYPPVHRFSYYQQLWPPDYDHRLPRTDEVAAREVTLPLFPGMTDAQLELVTTSIKDYFSH